ncbi:hypothetical protein ACP275_13G039900 [Erythranthe tilingii]
MAVKVNELDNDNKENIPPIISPNKSSPDTQSKFSKMNECRRRRKRTPLRDITHLYKAGAQIRQVDVSLTNLPSSVLVSVVVSTNRKRKSADDNSGIESCSKILRRDFR